MAKCATVHLRVQNYFDLHEVAVGRREPSDVRCAEIHEAVVDLRAKTLELPVGLVAQLGLSWLGGSRYGAVRLTIRDRQCHCDVIQVSDEHPVIVGWIALGMLDLVVDETAALVTGNPDHGGEDIVEMYCALPDS